MPIVRHYPGTRGDSVSKNKHGRPLPLWSSGAGREDACQMENDFNGQENSQNMCYNWYHENFQSGNMTSLGRPGQEPRQAGQRKTIPGTCRAWAKAGRREDLQEASVPESRGWKEACVRGGWWRPRGQTAQLWWPYWGGLSFFLSKLGG